MLGLALPVVLRLLAFGVLFVATDRVVQLHVADVKVKVLEVSVTVIQDIYTAAHCFTS